MTVKIAGREIDGILFDVDGTLYGKEEHSRIFDAIQLQLATALLAVSGKPEPSDDEIISMRKKYLDKVAEIGKWQRAFLELGGSPDQYRVLAANADRSRHLSFNPRLKQTLDNLKASPTKLGILTSAGLGVTRNTCAKLLGDDWKNLFAVVVCEDSLPDIQKPDSRAFQFALGSLVVVPERAAMVGDSIEDDILSAAALGMMTVKVGGEETGPWDLHINQVEELVNHLTIP